MKELNDKLVRMNDIRDRMKKHVEEYKKYQHYLEKVVAESGEFNSISDIFNRYETLIEARIILSEHQDKNLEILEERGTEMVNILLNYIYDLLVFHFIIVQEKKGKYLFLYSII